MCTRRPDHGCAQQPLAPPAIKSFLRNAGKRTPGGAVRRRAVAGLPILTLLCGGLGRRRTAASDARFGIPERALTRVETADARRDGDRDPDEPLGLLLVPPPQRLERPRVDRGDVLHDRGVPGARRRDRPPDHPLAEPLRHGRHAPARGRHREPPARVDVELVLPLGDPDLRVPDDRLPLQARQGRSGRERQLLRDDQPHVEHLRDAHPIPGLLDADRRDLLPLRRELPDLPRPHADDGRVPDSRLRAGRRRVGRQARPRPRPGRGEGRDPPRRDALAVRRGLRAGRRQARTRPALPRRPGDRQDHDGEGDRDRLQLALRLDSGLRVRTDLHRNRRHHRALPRAQGQEARPQVGRPVHRLHRRDRRCGHASPGAWRGRAHDPEHRVAAELLRLVGRDEPEWRPDRGERAVAQLDVRAARA